MSPDSSRLVGLGKIGRPHGVNGEVRLFLHNPESETLEKGMTVYLKTSAPEPVELTLEKVRFGPKFAILKFKDIGFRDQVDSFKHAELQVDYEDLPPLEEDEFYHLDLIGMPVFLATEEDAELPVDAEPYGEVSRFFETGANDVLVVTRNDGQELFVPVVDHAIAVIDLDEEYVLLQPLEIWTPVEDDESEDDKPEGEPT